MRTFTNIRSDYSERVNYNNAELPVYIGCDDIATYPSFSGVSHWHEDVEFVVVASGHMCYNVNGETIALNTGDGIFVNSRQLHYALSEDMSESEFVCLVVHPVLLCSSPYIERKFIVPILSDRSMPYHVLHKSVDWENRILNDLIKIYNEKDEPEHELKTQTLLFDIWTELFAHRSYISQELEPRSPRLSALRDMIAYIQKNYGDRITLDDIARSGAVGKTSCCSIFKQYTNQSPNSYLNEFRLRKAIKMLATTEMTVSEIGDEVGFPGASYFTEIFRKSVGTSPSEYRKSLNPH